MKKTIAANTIEAYNSLFGGSNTLSSSAPTVIAKRKEPEMEYPISSPLSFFMVSTVSSVAF